MIKEILTIDGQKKGTIELPKCFESEIREDLIKKACESEQSMTKPKYGAFPLAGQLTSAPKQMKHARSGYKSHYGQGISRVPRKMMSRSGTRFYRIGAFAPGTRGGRPAHPPKSWKNFEKGINAKERKKALYSAISAVAKNSFIVEKKFEELSKTKEIKNAISKIIPKAENILIVTSEKLRTKNLDAEFAIAKKILVNDIFPGGQPRKAVLWTEKAIGELK